ncbi:MAG: N-acetylmuramoyl-L-alanine amidase [Bacteroidota bacterium]
MRMRSSLVIPGALVLLAGCSSPVYYVQPREWRTAAAMDSVISLFRPFLAGHTIFMDPGHGGDDRANHGPAYDAIEADVNLRVALALRPLLMRAGANVILSRDKDTTIALADRAPMATRSGAEIFVSLHHNATGSGDNITNYSSVYYHSRPGLTTFHPANHDLARYIERDMSYAMRNPSPPSSPTFDGTLSDFDIYPNSGFAVLRAATMPAVLIEGSFFTHPHEEQRLSLEEFNRIEAWGIFVGLGRYFRAGIPQLALLSDTILAPPWAPASIGVLGPLPIDTTRIDVRIDGRALPTLYDTWGRTITAAADTTLTSGVHMLTATVRYPEGNSSWPFVRNLVVMLPPESLSVAVHPPSFPSVGAGSVRIACRVFDRNRMPVADGVPVRFASPSGLDTTIGTLQGSAYIHLSAPAVGDSVTMTVASGTQLLSIRRGRSREGVVWRGGTVLAEDDSLSLAEVSVYALDSTGMGVASDSTMGDGRYGVLLDPGRVTHLAFDKPGFFRGTKTRPSASDTIAMRPVAGRALFGKTYLVDARYGGVERGESDSSGLCGADVNLEVALRVASLLRWAGASPVLVRSSDTTLSEGSRIRFSTRVSGRMYIRIDAAGAAGVASCTIFPGLTNRRFAGSLLRGIRESARLDSAGIVDVRDRFHTDVAQGTITVIIPSPTTGAYRAGSASFEAIARGMFQGVVEAEGGKSDE